MSFLFGSTKTQGSTQAAAVGLQIQTSVYGLTLPLVYGKTRIQGNLMWYGDFVATAHTTSAGGGKGSGGSASSTSYTYTCSVMIGLCNGQISGVGQLWKGKNLTTLSAEGFSVGTGALGQAPWGYLKTYHPTQACPYSKIAYAAAGGLSLGDSSTLPNYNFEVMGRLYGTVSGQDDCDPRDVIADLLTDTLAGVSFPAAHLDSMTDYSNYCLASGLLISPAWTDQSTAADLVTQIALLTNSAPLWSEGLLKMVPYGDETITGNGVTYTPPTAALFDLTDDDFLYEEGQDPVQLTRKRAADAYNDIKLEFWDRSSNYDPAIAEAKNPALIAEFGLRFDSTQEAHMFCTADAAQTSADLLLKRQLAALNSYQFKLPIQWCILDPGDIVTITDAVLGLDHQWVRITQIDEDENSALTVTVEEYLQGAGTVSTYANTQTGQGYTPNYNEDPGLTVEPIFFEPPLDLSGGSYQVWAATHGPVDGVWGGCQVWGSTTGDSYFLKGNVTSPARMGTVVSDTGTSLSVDISASGGTLTSVSAADAATYQTLCYVDGEYIAFTTATLTATGKYTLTGLLRGLYGSTQSTHAAGTAFVRVDDALFKEDLDATYVGVELSFKLPAYNVWNGGLQVLADMEAFAYTPVGKPILDPPADVASLSVQQNGALATAKWPQVVSNYLTGYSLRYAPKGAFSWDSATVMTSVTRGTLITNSALPPGDWTVGIKAVAKPGDYGVTNYSVNATTCDITMANANDLISENQQDPAWPGTLTGLVPHHTGVLIPDSTKLAADCGWELFDSFVPSPVATCSYVTPEIDLGFDEDTVRLWATMTAVMGPGETGPSDPQLLADYRTDAGSYVGFKEWAAGYITARFIKMEMALDPSTGVAYFQAFQATVDASPRTETGTAVIPVGGASILFAKRYHTKPIVSQTPTGTTLLSAMRSTTTTTGFTVNVLDASGTDVGGTIDWTATGV